MISSSIPADLDFCGNSSRSFRQKLMNTEQVSRGWVCQPPRCNLDDDEIGGKDRTVTDVYMVYIPA